MRKKVLLSEKELVVAVLISSGFKDCEIAQKLNVSRRRICEIVHSLKCKFNVETRVGIGILTYQSGYVKIPEKHLWQ